MAKITSGRELLRRNLEDFLEKTTSDWASLLGGAPVFVTYYSRHRARSTEDQGLDDVMELAGAQSPISYSKVTDFMLFGVGELSATIELEDWGPATQYRGEATVLPDTVRPLPDDFFSLRAAGDEWLFKVSDAQPDRIHGKQFWKISFFLTTSSQASLEEQVTGEYVMVPTANASVEGKPAVVKAADFLLVEQADLVLDRILGAYPDLYLHPSGPLAGSPLYKLDDANFEYDQCLVRFCMRTSCLSAPRSFRRSVYPSDPMLWNEAAYMEYSSTVYAAVERGEPLPGGPPAGSYELVRINPDDRRRHVGRTPFHQAWQAVNLTRWVAGGPWSPVPGLAEAIASADDAAADALEPLSRAAARFARGTLVLGPGILDDLETVEHIPSRSHFRAAPMAAHAVRVLREKLAKKHTIV